MMPIADNPAGRLHDLLEKAEKISVGGNAIYGWGIVFGIAKPSDTLTMQQEFQIIQHLIETHRLIDETEVSLLAIEDLDHKLFLRPFPRIRQAVPMGQSLAGEFRALLNILSEGDRTVLEFCSRELSKRHVEQVVDEDVLSALLLEVNELFNEIEKAPINKTLKTFLLQQLETIRRAIQEYRIGGAKRLRKALASIVGSLFVDGAIVKEESKNEEVGKFKKIFYAFVSLVEFANKTTPLIEPVAKAIGLLLPVDEVPPVDTSSKS